MRSLLVPTLLLLAAAPMAFALPSPGGADPCATLDRVLGQVVTTEPVLEDGLPCRDLDQPPPPPEGPLPYWFGVVIQQDVPNGIPYVSGQLMDGCSFAAVPNHGQVTCTPPTPPPSENTYWVCTEPGVVVTAETGTVHGATQCDGGPLVTAHDTPGGAFGYNIAHGVWGFAWTCAATFGSPDDPATGNVLCDEPDPPVRFW